MSSIRHRQTMREFLASPEASAPAPVVPYHDLLPSATSSSRELAERKERIARPDILDGHGRAGLVPDGGSIAQIRTRDIHTDAAPDIAAQQRACYEAMQKMGVTQTEIEAVGEQVKTLPLEKLMQPLTWTSMLEKVRNFGRRRR
jgi:dienelactone hydrolase